MTAVQFDEVVAVAPARNLQGGARHGHDRHAGHRAQEGGAARRRPAVRPRPRPDRGRVALLLTIPVRHVYAALLRVGLLEVRA